MKPLAILKVLFITYLFSAVLLIILAFCLYKFGLGADKLQLGVMAIYGLSGFFGGFIAGKIAGEKKYIWGIILGICYFIVLGILSIIINGGFDLNYKNLLIQFALSTGFGMLGGMLA